MQSQGSNGSEACRAAPSMQHAHGTLTLEVSAHLFDPGLQAVQGASGRHLGNRSHAVPDASWYAERSTAAVLQPAERQPAWLSERIDAPNILGLSGQHLQGFGALIRVLGARVVRGVEEEAGLVPARGAQWESKVLRAAQ